MGAYLRAKFEVSSIILTSFRQGGQFYPNLHTSKQTTKKPTQIMIKACVGLFGPAAMGLPFKSFGFKKFMMVSLSFCNIAS